MDIITNTDTSIYPYNDSDMEYDLDTRQYLLTVEGVSNLLGENLATLAGSTNKANMFCLEISDIIYNFIYSHCRLSNIDIKRYLIAKDPDIRYLFKRILVAQMRYLIRSGGNLLGDFHGVNIEKGKALDINSLRGQIEVSSQAGKMLNQSGLLYSGHQYMDNDYLDDGTY